MTSRTVRATLLTSGLPPNVEPCLPAVKSFAALPLAKHAPIGTPLPRPLASVKRSGDIWLC